MEEYPRKGPIDHLVWGFSRFAMLLPAFVVMIMVYEVFMRYVMFNPTSWVNESSMWAGGFIFLFAGLYAMQQRSHIRIFLLYDIMPRWLRKTCDVLSTVFLLIFVMATVWGGYGQSYRAFMTWEKLDSAFEPAIPATMKPIILICLVVLAIQAVSNLITDWNTDPSEVVSDEDADVEQLKRRFGGEAD